MNCFQDSLVEVITIACFEVGSTPIWLYQGCRGLLRLTRHGSGRLEAVGVEFKVACRRSIGTLIG